MSYNTYHTYKLLHVNLNATKTFPKLLNDAKNKK